MVDARYGDRGGLGVVAESTWDNAEASPTGFANVRSAFRVGLAPLFSKPSRLTFGPRVPRLNRNQWGPVTLPLFYNYDSAATVGGALHELLESAFGTVADAAGDRQFTISEPPGQTVNLWKDNDGFVEQLTGGQVSKVALMVEDGYVGMDFDVFGASVVNPTAVAITEPSEALIPAQENITSCLLDGVDITPALLRCVVAMEIPYTDGRNYLASGKRSQQRREGERLVTVELGLNMQDATPDVETMYTDFAAGTSLGDLVLSVGDGGTDTLVVSATGLLATGDPLELKPGPLAVDLKAESSGLVFTCGT